MDPVVAEWGKECVAQAQTLELAPDYGYTAATDQTFDNIRDNPAFIALVGG